MSQSIVFMCFKSDTEERNCCIIPSRRWWLPCEVCKGKEIRENLSWLRQRFRVKHPQSPFSYNSDISQENQSCCSTQQLVQSWRCSDTRGFSMLPFIGFLADKSLDFWHGWRFWQWQVKTCRIRVQLCTGVGWLALCLTRIYKRVQVWPKLPGSFNHMVYCWGSWAMALPFANQSDI